MAILHNLGFPRIGASRELKFALESYWQGQTGSDDLLEGLATAGSADAIGGSSGVFG